MVDGANSFNISTTSSLVIAQQVVRSKHGNRAVSSKSGAADVLEALGVKIDVAPERSTQLLKDIQHLFLICTELSYCDEICRDRSVKNLVSVPYSIFLVLSESGRANMELMGVYMMKV